MPKQRSMGLIAALFCFSICLIQMDGSLAQEKALTAADVIGKHLESIGKPEILAKTQSRGIVGRAAFNIITGGAGSNKDGKFMFLSAGKNLGLKMKFDDLNYPEEHFGFNGREVTVKDMTPGHKSPLADFIFRYNGLMKEGFIGGELSTSWALLSYREGQPRVYTYKLEQIKDKNFHVLETKVGDVKIKLFFDPKSFRHVRTEYSVRIKNDTSANKTVRGEPEAADTSASESDMRRLNDLAPQATIHETEPDSIYILIEKFDRFSTADGLTLPTLYGIEYSVEGHGASFVAEWSIIADTFLAGGAKIDQSFFVVQ